MARNDVAQLLKTARLQAGMTQRDLARKAHTAQSVVARVELGETSPTWHTLARLLRAAGFNVVPELKRIRRLDRSELDDVARILRLTPEERLLEAAHVSRFLAAARRV
ncbi:MAG TPA: helix-turn-helix transcriptional regulator [Gemmatimonadaceae bacterium]|nr:helix-turn-helix transcriptional regulator [Gemmatimonadaceae bacterium]